MKFLKQENSNEIILDSITKELEADIEEKDISRTLYNKNINSHTTSTNNIGEWKKRK